MHQDFRYTFNNHFSNENYQSLIASVHKDFPGVLDFRIAETPVFLTDDFIEKCRSAGEEIIDFIIQPDFKKNTEKAIPIGMFTPNEDDCPQLLSIDFAISQNEMGELTPYLIELQGFATLFNYQSYLADKYITHFNLPDTLTPYFNGLEREDYLSLLEKTLLASLPPEEVILLELFPHKQKTRIDFVLAKEHFGIETVCLTKIVKKDRNLFYQKNGKLQKISRIYNRVILDELATYKDLDLSFHFTEEVDVSWVSHPNWFFRISKYLLPLLSGKYIPESYFLSDYDLQKSAIDQYVLKPLYSFAGSGVDLHPTKEKLYNILEKDQYLMQRKIKYEPVIESLDGKVKAEVRLMYLWDKTKSRPTLATNITRLSRGEMIGVRYNHSFDWVGGTIGFSQKGLK
ncbi:MAG: hypothetical protein EBS35_01205 [Bacteroidetes bacterium]|nr:hypothetical protein [Bacteroidota bacterium]